MSAESKSIYKKRITQQADYSFLWKVTCDIISGECEINVYNFWVNPAGTESVTCVRLRSAACTFFICLWKRFYGFLIILLCGPPRRACSVVVRRRCVYSHREILMSPSCRLCALQSFCFLPQVTAFVHSYKQWKVCEDCFLWISFSALWLLLTERKNMADDFTLCIGATSL